MLLAKRHATHCQNVIDRDLARVDSTLKLRQEVKDVLEEHLSVRLHALIMQHWFLPALLLAVHDNIPVVEALNLLMGLLVIAVRVQALGLIAR